MATSVFPSLDIRPVQQQQPDMIGQIGKIVALRQAMQMQPLQLQQAQMQVQQEQMNLQSSQALMKAFTDAKGDPTQTIQNAAQSGQVLPKDLLAFQTQQIAYKKNLQDMTKTQLANMDTQGYNMRQILDPIAAEKDPVQQAQDWAAAKQKLISDPDAATKYGITDPSKIPDYQSPQQVQLYDATLTGHQKAVADQLKVAQAAEAQAKVPMLQAQAQDFAAAKAQNPDLTYTQYLAQQKGAIAGAVEAQQFPYKARIAAILSNNRLQLFGTEDAMRQNDAADKNYQGELNKISNAESDLNLAVKSGNIVAARSAMAALAGVEAPTTRMTTKMFDEKYGSLPQQVQQSLRGIFTGDKITPELGTAMKSYLDSRKKTATDNMNRSIDEINRTHDTNMLHVPPPDPSAVPGTQGATGRGPATKPPITDWSQFPTHR
jgi:hypothetical protein